MNKQDRIEHAKTLIRRKGEPMAAQAIANLTFLDKGEVIQLIQAIKNPGLLYEPARAAPKFSAALELKVRLDEPLAPATADMLSAPTVEPSLEPEAVEEPAEAVDGQCPHTWSKVFNSRRVNGEPGARRRRKCVDCGERFSTKEVVVSETYRTKELDFNIDDRVEKVGGDYELSGTVVAAFRKASGQVRYVVEADEPRGLLHIYSAKNLKLIEPAD